MSKRRKYYLTTFGCPKNEVDGQVLEYHLKLRGLSPAATPDDADILIVNTCGFIEDAKSESIEGILSLAEYKHNGKKLAVIGCLSQRYKNELKAELPEVDYFFGISSPKKIAETFVGADNKIIEETFNLNGKYEIQEGRVVGKGIPYAYLKIADGCDNRCSYCVIPSIRGRFRSKPLDNIVKEVDYLLGEGIKEIILVAQETTRYGYDLGEDINLTALIRELTADNRLRWLRILYAHPIRTTMALLEEISANDKVCNYLDIPLQQISDKMLSRMNRHISSKETEKLISTIKSKFPKIALRTTFMLGHPGETEADFQELLDFIEKFRFENIGCFLYSEEENTISAQMPDKVPLEIARERQDRLMSLQDDIVEERNSKRIGEIHRAIIDKVDLNSDGYICRMESQAPEIDGIVVAKGDNLSLEAGDFVDIKLIDFESYDFEAIIVGENQR